MAYVSRIPIDSKYAEMLGRVLYNFAYTEWAIIYLGSLAVPSFVSREAGNDSKTISREFQLIAQAITMEGMQSIANRFVAAEERRVEFLRSTPITGPDGAQILSANKEQSPEQWTMDAVEAYALELENLAIDANNLYNAHSGKK